MKILLEDLYYWSIAASIFNLMKSIMAKKLNMTQLWTESGKVIPVTVVEALQAKDFAPGEVIDIQGKSKGRGFAGAVKRHGFHGAPASHGHDHPRAVGSIGQRFPQHVRPGMRMAGRMGGKGATVKNSVVLAVDPDKNLLFVKGGVTGARNSKLKIVATGKKKELPKLVEYKA